MQNNQHLFQHIKKFKFGLFLFVLSILAYGLLSNFLGFFADDWYIIWFYKTFGSLEFTKFFALDRPYLSWMYIFFTSIFQDSPLAWQIFAVFTRFLTGLAYWYVLENIWPRNYLLTRWAAVLFLVFPGFSEQWMAIMYSQVFLLLAAYLLSIGLMLFAMQKPGYWLAALLPGWIMATYALFAVEYFLGLEVFRLLAIFVVLKNEGKLTKAGAIQALKFWAPFGLTTAVFLFWRVFIWESYMYQIQPMSQIVGGSIKGLVTFAHTIVLNLLDILVISWNNLVSLVQQPPLGASVILMWGVVIVGILVTWFFRRTLLPPEFEEQEPAVSERDYLQSIALGLLVILGSMVPFRAAGLEISLTPPFDRFMIIFALGAGLVAVGLLGYLVNRPYRRFVLLILMISFSLGMQFKFANTYRRIWNAQKDFLWQLVWRVPGIEPGTILMTDMMPFGFYYSDMSLSAPLNLIYDQPVIDRKMAYQFIFSELNPKTRNFLNSNNTEEPITFNERSFGFSGIRSKVISYKFLNEACLQILDPKIDTVWQFNKGGTNEVLITMSKLSKKDLILVNEESPDLPSRYFDSEPAHGWCYYYQKADLALQRGEWETILKLYDEASSEGFTPTNESEWFPFIIAFMNAGRWDEIEQVLPLLFPGHNSRDELLCRMWADLTQAAPLAVHNDPGYQSFELQVYCSP